MKIRSNFLLTIVFLTISLPCISGENSPWDKWIWLIGEWKGEGNGQPGQGDGTFTFYNDLDGKVLIRKSHTAFPANGNKPAFAHDDLMIVSLDYAGNPAKAIYFDNEGHTIQYAISYGANAVILQSEKIANIPVFRLTYTSLDSQTVGVKFEMSGDGMKFITYLEGKSTKVK